MKMVLLILGAAATVPIGEIGLRIARGQVTDPATLGMLLGAMLGAFGVCMGALAGLRYRKVGRGRPFMQLSVAAFLVAFLIFSVTPR